jgi:tripartite-type tricarboxylate transporter receptor subunit TctC
MPVRRSTRLLHALIATAAAALPSLGHGQGAATYPDKPVRFVVPFPPGGGTDILARLIGQKLGERWGQTFVIDNRGGAAGAIGAEVVAKSLPDGYTIMMAFGSHASNATLYPNLPFDPVNDFAMVSLAVISPMMLVVHPSLPVKNVKELVAYAKIKPVSYGSSGNGSPPHLAMELLKQSAGFDMVHVPYKGIAPATTAQLGNEVQAAFTVLIVSIPHHKSGRLRGIAVSTAKRFPTLPDVPTVAESGVPGFDAPTWYGIMAPAKTPPAVVAKLHKEITSVLNAPDMRERLLNEGNEPVVSTPEEFRKFLQADIEKWAKIIKLTGAKPD